MNTLTTRTNTSPQRTLALIELIEHCEKVVTGKQQPAAAAVPFIVLVSDGRTHGVAYMLSTHSTMESIGQHSVVKPEFIVRLHVGPDDTTATLYAYRDPIVATSLSSSRSGDVTEIVHRSPLGVAGDYRNKSHLTSSTWLLTNGNASEQLWSSVPQRDYDEKGAVYFAVAVILFYGISIAMLVAASTLKRSHTDYELKGFLRSYARIDEERRSREKQRIRAVLQRTYLNKEIPTSPRASGKRPSFFGFGSVFASFPQQQLLQPTCVVVDCSDRTILGSETIPLDGTKLLPVVSVTSLEAVGSTSSQVSWSKRENFAKVGRNIGSSWVVHSVSDGDVQQIRASSAINGELSGSRKSTSNRHRSFGSWEGPSRVWPMTTTGQMSTSASCNNCVITIDKSASPPPSTTSAADKAEAEVDFMSSGLKDRRQKFRASAAVSSSWQPNWFEWFGSRPTSDSTLHVKSYLSDNTWLITDRGGNLIQTARRNTAT